ncbi:MAG: molybdopterin molybdotransferase MoeA [Desulfobacterota bacterium]|jgi:molybdopterin molybdotransferase|nr:molybdopterin molybdotransferase MoeA [Thermodesulfobacteriota bacterium]
MKPFLHVKHPEDILEIIGTLPSLASETVFLEESLNRVLSEPLHSPEDLPHFPRATMDGYAVKARDTFGASESIPALLTLAGEIVMGQSAEVPVFPGQCFRIATGGMLPPGADAVVMIEHTQVLDAQTIEVFRSVSPGDHLIRIGEDLKRGQPMIPRGHRLRPQDLGLLAGVGIRQVTVCRRPRVAIISTGDEIVSIDRKPPPGSVRDINAYTLPALVEKNGGIPLFLGLVRDSREALRGKCREALEQADMVLVSGGSSVGTRDFTLEVIESFPASQVLAHGIAISPGKPTILARIGEKVLWGLPGHTASAMVVFSVFVKPCLNRLEGAEPAKINPGLRARLTRNLASAQGRDDYIRVALQAGPQGWEAEPILGQSGLISTLVRSDGLVRIDRFTEGKEKGDWVEVFLF